MINNITKAKGIIIIAQSPKPILIPNRFSKLPLAIALGGVPIGVPIPPILAATGIDKAKPIRPFPSAGSEDNTGVKIANIMVAVAVLLINIEKTAVTKINPNITISERVPKGANITLAKAASNLYFVAVIANTKPPMNNMIVGSANEAIKALLPIGVPNVGSSTRIKLNILSEVVNNISTNTKTDVVQIGIASDIHIQAAKIKRAITRCSIIVNPGIPKLSNGINHAINVNTTEIAKPIIFFESII